LPTALLLVSLVVLKVLGLRTVPHIFQKQKKDAFFALEKRTNQPGKVQQLTCRAGKK
jgi:hypothetical protein